MEKYLAYKLSASTMHTPCSLFVLKLHNGNYAKLTSNDLQKQQPVRQKIDKMQH